MELQKSQVQLETKQQTTATIILFNDTNYAFENYNTHQKMFVYTSEFGLKSCTFLLSCVFYDGLQKKQSLTVKDRGAVLS